MPTTSTDGYTITFSQGYTYNGGNLLIGVYNVATGSYNNVTWYGNNNQSSVVSAFGSNYSSLDGVGFNTQTFIPKTTFTYNTPAPTAVDLGLPSGTKWADMNVGAGSETGAGTYFAWAATASQANYSQAYAPYYSGSSWSKYTGSDYATLQIGDDAATANWGSDWRMPTKDEAQELIDYTDHEWATIGVVSGYKFMKKSDHSVYIFLPLAGNMDVSELKNTSYGFYWTSTLTTNNVNCGVDLRIQSNEIKTMDHNRFFGFSVRPVQMFAGKGTEASPYLIASTTDWNELVSAVNGGETYSGKYFKMTANVGTVSTWMTGTFSGTFDGYGNTLTVGYSATTNNCAPFGYLNGTVQNLKVAGNISTSKQYAGGVAAWIKTGHTANVTNCRVAATINSTFSGDGSSAGFVAYVDGRLNVTGCAFTGTLAGSNAYAWGGFVSYNVGRSDITNCLFAPASVTAKADYSATVGRNGGGTLNFANFYYTQKFNTAQGLQARTIAKGNGVSSLSVTKGEATATYTVSGITVYSGKGIDFNDGSTTTFYGGSGQSVSLALTHETPSGYWFKQYAVDKGTIASETTDTPTLTMPDANSTANDVVTISAEYDPAPTAVDLGLPSGKKWANRNVGALSETGYGTYYAWAATASQADYSEANAPYYSGSAYTKYTGSDYTMLQRGDDAATVNWGSNWRMPTDTELQELIDNTTQVWKTDYNGTGVNGYLVKSKTNDNSIFLPAAGWYYGTELRSASQGGNYWMSTVVTSDVSCGYSLNFYTTNHAPYKDNTDVRYVGFSIRPVQMFAGEGTQASPYLIASTTDWDNLVSAVNAGETYSGNYFKMTANVGTVSTWMTGDMTTTGIFSGHFDGDGHTLTVNYSSDTQYCHPFGFLKGATIENLHVTGNITTTQTFAAGLASRALSNSTNYITNCLVSTNITSTRSGTANICGVVMSVQASATLYIEGCAFTGSITSSNGTDNGGFSEWVTASGVFSATNCLFAPSSVTVKSLENSVTFCRNGGTFNNCYYTQTLGTAQGIQARTIAKGNGVNSLSVTKGSGTTYNVAGITVYSNGIDFNDGNTTTFYGGSEQTVSLALTAETRSGYQFKQYAASQGSLSDQTTDTPTLTMPAANSTANDVVTISAEYDPTYNADFASGNDNDHWTISPTQQIAGGTVTVSYEGENKVKSVTVTANPSTLAGLKAAINDASDLTDLNTKYLGKYVTATGAIQSSSEGAVGIIGYISKTAVDNSFDGSRIFVLATENASNSASQAPSNAAETTYNNSDLNGYAVTNAWQAAGYAASTAGWNYSASRPDGASHWFVPSYGQWVLGGEANNKLSTVMRSTLVSGAWYAVSTGRNTATNDNSYCVDCSWWGMGSVQRISVVRVRAAFVY